MNKQWFRLLFTTAVYCATLLPVAPASAHFIWVARSSETGKCNVCFGEDTAPDQADFLDGIKHMQVWSGNPATKFEAAKFTRQEEHGEGWFEIQPAAENGVDVDCVYGIFDRGDTSMLLHYCAMYRAYKPGDSFADGTELPVDLSIDAVDGKLKFELLHNQTAAAKAEITCMREADGVTETLTTDDQGVAECDLPVAGRYLVRAKIVDSNGGEYEGKTYDEKRSYCTLVLDLQPRNAAEATAAASVPVVPAAKISDSRTVADLPVGLASFGAAAMNNGLYVFGGHSGEPHDYYREGQNGKLLFLDLNQPSQWQTLNETTGLQGLAMVAHKGQLYRIGGFAAHNEHGDDADLRSVTEFARFDFESKAWVGLAALPEPRSSLDAVVVGDTLYVAGGWQLSGDNDSGEWATSALSIDLADANATWQTLPEPTFERRAISLGHRDGKLFAIGGMQSSGGITNDVAIFDLASQSWSDGPALPAGSAMEGFGSSCFNIDGQLLVTTYGGSLLRLNEAGDSWDKASKMETGRFFHRMLPVGNGECVLLGGANMSIGKLTESVVLKLED